MPPEPPEIGRPRNSSTTSIAAMARTNATHRQAAAAFQLTQRGTRPPGGGSGPAEVSRAGPSPIRAGDPGTSPSSTSVEGSRPDSAYGGSPPVPSGLLDHRDVGGPRARSRPTRGRVTTVSTLVSPSRSPARRNECEYDAPPTLATMLPSAAPMTVPPTPRNDATTAADTAASALPATWAALISGTLACGRGLRAHRVSHRPGPGLRSPTRAIVSEVTPARPASPHTGHDTTARGPGPAGAASRCTSPPVDDDQPPHDGQTQPGAAVVPGAGLVEPGEPLERALAVRLGDARRRRRSPCTLTRPLAEPYAEDARRVRACRAALSTRLTSTRVTASASAAIPHARNGFPGSSLDRHPPGLAGDLGRTAAARSTRLAPRRRAARWRRRPARAAAGRRPAGTAVRCRRARRRRSDPTARSPGGAEPPRAGCGSQPADCAARGRRRRRTRAGPRRLPPAGRACRSG